MWINYLKVALRSLFRRKMYTLINIFGLSVAMGCAIVGYLNYQFNTSWDSFHTKADHIYRLGSTRLINNTDVGYGIVPSPVAEIVATQITGVEQVVRYEGTAGVVRIGETVFNEQLYFSDPSLFDMFTFPTRTGNAKAALNNPDQVVISEDYAAKYFGSDVALGKSVAIRIGGEEMREFTVGAVVSEIPQTSSIRFDMLLNIRLLEEFNISNPADWKDWLGSLFFESTDPSVAGRVREIMKEYVAVQNSANQNLQISGFFVTPLLKVAGESRDLRNNMLVHNSPLSSFIGSLAMVGIIVLLACFNYVNTTLAFSASRLKEVGIRKVVGGRRDQIIFQFLGEQVVLCSFSLIAGLGIAELMIKGWNMLWSWNQLALTYHNNLPLVFFLILMVLVIALVAGFYPAYYVSRFRPADILKGQMLHAKINHFMRGMLVFQFALSLVAIIQAIAFTDNAEYVEKMDLGFARERRIMVPLAEESMYAPFRDAMTVSARIRNVTAGQDHVFFGFRRRPVVLGEKKVESDVLRVEPTYPSAMIFRLKRGRLFETNLKSDESGSVIITENLARALDLGDGIGATLEVEDQRYTVVGVVEDFLNRGVWDPASPVLFRCVTDQHRFVIVETGDDPNGETFAFVKETWARLNPNAPFPGVFQDRMVAEAIQVSESITKMNVVSGFLAFAMAILGLFSLVSLKTIRRTKEIGIRKVMGASVGQILGLMNREFMILTLIAVVFGDLIGYFMTTALLDAIYAYHTEVSAEAIGIASVSSLVIAAVTSIWVVAKTARANPVESLRYE